jgi:Holliday junction DNA helicase RuvA
VGTLSPGEFALAVITGDIKTITRVRGVGKKGAERLILELKDKIKGAEGMDATTVGGSDIADGRPHSRQQEAISALMVLGYSSGEASQAIKAVDDGNQELEELIKLGLRQLMK